MKAKELKATRDIKRYLAQQLESPDADFATLLTSKVYTGKKTQGVMAQYTEFAKNAFQQLVSDKIQSRLQKALQDEALPAPRTDETVTEPIQADNPEPISATEYEAFYIVKAILRETIDPKRLYLRDKKGYCAVLIDNSQNKTVCWLRVNSDPMRIEMSNADGVWEVRTINALDDIFQFNQNLRDVAILRTKPKG